MWDNHRLRPLRKQPKESIRRKFNVDDNRKRALDAALGQIEKQYGKGAIMRMGDDANRHDVPVVSTGSLALDVALGIGGLPRGRVVEVYGPESSGKTTLARDAGGEGERAVGTAAVVHAKEAVYSSSDTHD